MTRRQLEEKIRNILQIEDCTFDESIKRIADLVEGYERR